MQRYINDVHRLVDSIPPHMGSTLDEMLSKRSVTIQYDDIDKLISTFPYRREFFFEGHMNRKRYVIDNVYASMTGTVDEHDATIDPTSICGHTHPNVSNRMYSPPSSFDVHAMVVALQESSYKRNTTLYFSHIVVSPEGLYVITIHPIWITQKRSTIDYILQETYQSFDVLTGGVPETRESPYIDIDTYIELSKSIGVHIQYYDYTDNSDDIEVDIYSSSRTFFHHTDITLNRMKTVRDELMDSDDDEYGDTSKKLIF